MPKNEELNDLILWPTLSDSVLEQSELSSITFTHDQDNIRQVESSSPVKIEAIKEDVLAKFVAFQLAEKHAETYTNFSNHVKRVKDSDFFQKMLEYKQYYFRGQILTFKLEISKESCTKIADKCWNLISKQAQYDQECGDGKSLTCYTTIDSAVFNQEKAAELIKLNDAALDMSRELLYNDYLANIAKLYIQNYLDGFLQEFLELLLSYSTVAEKMDGWDRLQMIGIL